MRSLDSYPDPDPEGQKWLTRLINFIFCSAGCSLLRAEGFSCSLDVLYGSLEISKLQFLIKKKIQTNFQLSSIFLSSVFGHQTLNPDWIQIWIHLKCWIRIRIRIKSQWNRIHNTALLKQEQETARNAAFSNCCSYEDSFTAIVYKIGTPPPPHPTYAFKFKQVVF